MSIISDLKPDVKNTVKWIAIGLGGMAALATVIFIGWTINGRIADAEKRKQAEINESIAISNRDGLVVEIEKIKKNLAEIEKKNQELVAGVEESKKKIADAKWARDEALRKLREAPIPEQCDDQFDWLKDQAAKMKEEYDER